MFAAVRTRVRGAETREVERIANDPDMRWIERSFLGDEVGEAACRRDDQRSVRRRPTLHPALEARPDGRHRALVPPLNEARRPEELHRERRQWRERVSEALAVAVRKTDHVEGMLTMELTKGAPYGGRPPKPGHGDPTAELPHAARTPGDCVDRNASVYETFGIPGALGENRDIMAEVRDRVRQRRRMRADPAEPARCHIRIVGRNEADAQRASTFVPKGPCAGPNDPISDRCIHPTTCFAPLSSPTPRRPVRQATA